MEAKEFAAWFGAVTGGITLSLKIYEWVKDRERLVLDGNVSRFHDCRSNRTSLRITVEATNHSRRVIVIKRAGLMAPDYYDMPEFGLVEQGEYKSLTESQSHKWEIDFEIKELERLYGRIWFLFVEDTHGKIHKLYKDTDLDWLLKPDRETLERTP